MSSIGRETLDKKGNGINLSSDKNLNHIFNKWKEILVRAQFLDFSAIFVDPPFLASDLSAPSTDRVNCTFDRPHPVKSPSIPGCRLWVVGTPCWLGTLPSVLLGVSNRYFFPSNLPKCLIRKLYSCIVVVFRSFFSKFPVGYPGEWTWSATGSVTSDVRWKRAYSFPVTVFNKTVSGIVQGKHRSVIGYTSPLVPRNSPRSLCKS